MNIIVVFYICMSILSASVEDVRRIDVQMQDLMEDLYMQLENPENSSVVEWKQQRQIVSEFYMDVATYYLPPNRLVYWMEEINNVDKDFKKEQKHFKDYEQ